jgi:integrase/recombinase XerC
VENGIDQARAAAEPECRVAPFNDEPSATTSAHPDGAQQGETTCEWGVTGELLGTSPLHSASVENQTRDVPDPADGEQRQCAVDQQPGGGVPAEVWRTSAAHAARVAHAHDVRVGVDPQRQLGLFDTPERDAVTVAQDKSQNGGRASPAETTDTGAAPPDVADRAILRTLEEALAGAREAGDNRPALVVLASRLGDLGTARAPALADRVSLREARDEWLRRLEAQQRSESTLVGYRVAIDDLLDWSNARDRDVFEEAAIVDYLHSYRERASPAQSTYYRRFVLLRRFLRWVSGRRGLPDPFRDLQSPPKPRQESDWLTPEEFRRLLDAAGHPERNLPGLAERDQLVLLILVLTGLRRSELCALDWRDLDLDGRKPSLLVRSGKGGKSRRQPIPTSLARQLQRLANAHNPEPADPVFCGLQRGRLQQTVLADIIARAAKRAGIEKHVTAHTLRHTAATWLRQELGDTRLVAEYLGHADLSTVARYAHVDRDELHDAAGRQEGAARRSLRGTCPTEHAGRARRPRHSAEPVGSAASSSPPWPGTEAALSRRSPRNRRLTGRARHSQARRTALNDPNSAVVP